MKKIYPKDTRSALEVFRIYEAQGNFFDISDPAYVIRGEFSIVHFQMHKSVFFIKDNCIGCGNCLSECPQSCIDISNIPAVIDQNRCLHCGQCIPICPVEAIIHRS